MCPHYIPNPFGRHQPLEFAAGWVESDDGYLAAFGIASHPGVKLIQGMTLSGWQGSVEPVNGFWLLEATPPAPGSGAGSGPGSIPHRRSRPQRRVGRAPRHRGQRRTHPRLPQTQLGAPRSMVSGGVAGCRTGIGFCRNQRPTHAPLPRPLLAHPAPPKPSC